MKNKKMLAILIVGIIAVVITVSLITGGSPDFTREEGIYNSTEDFVVTYTSDDKVLKDIDNVIKIYEKELPLLESKSKERKKLSKLIVMGKDGRAVISVNSQIPNFENLSVKDNQGETLSYEANKIRDYLKAKKK